MNKPVILRYEKKDGSGKLISHESLVDVSGMKPGQLLSIEDTFEYEPECYWGGFRDPEDRKERFNRVAEGVLYHLKPNFPDVYCKRTVGGY